MLKLCGNFLFVKMFSALRSQLTVELWSDKGSLGQQILRKYNSVILFISEIMLSSINKNVALGQINCKENIRRGLYFCGKEKIIHGLSLSLALSFNS